MNDQSNSKTLMPIRYTNNNAASSSKNNNTRTNLTTTNDIDQQKENKFKQIFDQSTVDLSKNDFYHTIYCYFS
jgi:hypothetical protein